MNRLTRILALAGTILSSSLVAQDAPDRDRRDNNLWDLITEYFFIDSRDFRNDRDDRDEYFRLLNFEGLWKFQIGNNDEWASADYIDDEWEKIYAPADWENEGFHGYDGFAWYRIHFDGKQLKPNENHYVMLGAIDDVDETYVNGAMVGRTGRFPPKFRTAYNADRKYRISNDLINFDGDNVIAVKVYDEYQNGGIVNGQIGLYVSAQSQSLLQNLSGPWKFTTKNRRDNGQLDIDDSRWDEIIVPEQWDNQGYRSFDGTAWYRKQFQLNFTPDPEENYYLILGRIDDFDITYFNGEIIGETRDYRRLGESTSYRKMRIYRIPSRLLTDFDKHLISIKVEDIGLEGGIYSGAIGIATEGEITRIMRN